MGSKKFTYRQILAVNRAIDRVRDKENMVGATVPGCTFSSPIMFLNAYNQNSIKGTVEGIIDGAKPIRAKFKDDKDEWVENGLNDFLKEEGEYLKTIAKGVDLRSYSLTELQKIDDEHLQKANVNTPVPQEFYSLLMEAGLIDDDL